MTVTDRRLFLAGLAAFGLAGPSRPVRAAPTTRYAAARFDPGDVASLALFDGTGRELAVAALPERAHDSVVSPDGRLLVVVARRPGRFALVLDAETLAPLARLTPPPGAHFTGHGRFSADGRRFFTAETDMVAERGRIGIHDVASGFVRVAGWDSGGVGPHDLALLPDGRHLVVANGGIATDPATGRDRVVRETMRSNLTVLALDDGAIVASSDLGEDLRLASIRHLAVADDGEVVFGCQYEGEAGDGPPLVGAWAPAQGTAPRLWDMPDPSLARFCDYVGSVALDTSGRFVAAASPRGGHLALFARASGGFLGLRAMADVCGLAAADQPGDFLATSGAAGVRRFAATAGTEARIDGLGEHVWDNHLTRLGRRS